MIEGPPVLCTGDGWPVLVVVPVVVPLPPELIDMWAAAVEGLCWGNLLPLKFVDMDAGMLDCGFTPAVDEDDGLCLGNGTGAGPAC